MRGLGLALGLGVHVVLTRALGVENYGDYVYVLNWVLILTVAGRMGLDTAALRFVAKYRELGQWRLLHGYVQRSTRIALAISTLLAGALVLSAWAFASRGSAYLLPVFILGGVLLPSRVWLHVRSAQLQALKEIIWARISVEVIPPLLTIAGILVAAWYATDLQLPAAVAMGIEVASTGIACILATKWLKQHLPPRESEERPEYDTRAWLVAAMPMFLCSEMNVVINRADTIMIGAMIGTEEAGIYSIASKVASLALFGLMGANMIAAPMISQLYTSRSKDSLTKVLRYSSMIAAGFCAIVSIVLLVAGRTVLSVFGSSFIGAYNPMVILLAGQAVSAICGPAGFLMTMTGHELSAAKVLSSSALLNILLNATLIPLYGMIGAAIATATSIALWNIAMVFVSWRKLGVRPTPI